MENKVDVKDIAYILYLVTEKYENYRSNRNDLSTKLTCFKERIVRDKFCKKYSCYYVNNYTSTIDQQTLADDLINIAVVLSNKTVAKNPNKIKSIDVENLDLYILLIRDKSCDEIDKLNKMILDNEALNKIREARIYFDTDLEYLDSMRSFLSQKYFRYKLLDKTRISCSDAIDKLRNEIYVALDELKEEKENKNISNGELKKVLSYFKPERNLYD